MNVKTQISIIFVGILVVMGTSFGISKWMSHTTRAQIIEDINKENQHLPRQVDEITTLNQISFDTNTISYHYTLKVAEGDYPSFKTAIRTKVEMSLCETPAQKLTKLFQLSYIYKDKNDTLIDTFVIPRGHCS